MNGLVLLLATFAVFLLFHGFRYTFKIREAFKAFVSLVQWERREPRVRCDKPVNDPEEQSTITSAQIARAKRRRAKK